MDQQVFMTLVAVLALGALLVFRLVQAHSRRTKALALLKDGAWVVDVRSQAEFAQDHYPGAFSLPVDELEEALAQRGQIALNHQAVEKSQPLVTYCLSGVRSGRAVLMLKKAGYTRVHNAGTLATLSRGPSSA